MNQDLSILHLVVNASFIVQLVMLLLLIGSITSWAAIFRKLRALKNIKTQNEEFERDFWSGTSLNDLYAAAAQNAKQGGPMERIFASGMREYQKLRERRISDAATLLDGARSYWGGLDSTKKSAFRFHHISTDEVYGDLHGTDDLFTETTPYAPSSPYSASKASSDHLVRAWQRTYGLPTLVTNCSNNYGPYHFPEKLIPLVILNALEGKPLPVYGQGEQIRDWLYVEDHARALYTVITQGHIGATYNIGGHNEKRNIDVVRSLCALLDELQPRADGQSYAAQITFVTDRPGHDLRYAIDAQKIQHELGWVPQETFDTGLRKTVAWYLDNLDWCRQVQDGSYRRERLGRI